MCLCSACTVCMGMFLTDRLLCMGVAAGRIADPPLKEQWPSAAQVSSGVWFLGLR